MEMGKKLKILREDSGLSIKKIAQSLNISPSTYREWEYGRKIQGEPYLAICQLYQISLNELFSNQNTDYLEFLELVNQVKSSLSRLELICGSSFTTK